MLCDSRAREDLMKKVCLISALVVLLSGSQFLGTPVLAEPTPWKKIKKPGKKCRVEITSPCRAGSTATLQGKKPIKIRWNPSFNSGGNVSIAMKYANCKGKSGPVPAGKTTVSTSTPNNGRFTWAAPRARPGKCYQIVINKIGAKCSGKSGIFTVSSNVGVTLKSITPAQAKKKYGKHIDPLAKMIAEGKSAKQIEMATAALLTELYSKGEAEAGAAADEATLAAIESQVAEQIAADLAQKSNATIDEQKEQIQKALELIKEMMERKSDMIDKTLGAI